MWGVQMSGGRVGKGVIYESVRHFIYSTVCWGWRDAWLMCSCCYCCSCCCCCCHIYLIACDFVLCVLRAPCAVHGWRKRKWQRQEARQTNANVWHFEELCGRSNGSSRTLTDTHTHLRTLTLVTHMGMNSIHKRQTVPNSTRLNLKLLLLCAKVFVVSIFICWLLISIYILYCLQLQHCVA